VTTRNQHVAWISQHLVASGVDESEAQERAEAALQMFLDEAEVEFGHTDYNWNKAAAKITAKEYLKSMEKGEAA
jgi:hypothetical protein